MDFTMMLYRSVILSCCAIILIHQQVEAIEMAVFIRQWETNLTYKPEIVQVQDNVYLVSLQNHTVNIALVEEKPSSLTCKLPVSPNKIVSSKITPVALGNGKVLIRGSMTINKIEAPNKVKPVEQLFLIVDPHDCSTVKIIKEFPCHPRYFEAVIPYSNTFDLFYSSSRNSTECTTAPKRYDDNGEPVQLDYYLAPDTNIRGLVIQSLKPYDPSGHFFAAFMREEDGLINLQLLDDRLKVLKESLTENSVDYVSTLYDSITYCYTKPSIILRHKTEIRQQIFCELLDVDLKHKATVHLYDPEGTYVVDAVVNNLPTGGAIIALAHKYKNPKSNYNEQPVDFFLQYVNPDGTTHEAVKLGTYPSYFFRMYGTLTGNGEFCLVIVGESKPPLTPLMDLNFGVHVKCIDSKKLYLK